MSDESRAIQIKTEIPKESSGRLLDALTDIIRPFTEKRGLRADQVRLQREEVAIEIARRARQRLALEERPTIPPPTKFMIPFLEKASLEDMESELIDHWAALLSGAATNFDSAMVRYCSVLAEIGPREASLLDRLVRKCRSGRILPLLDDVPYNFRHVDISTKAKALLRRTKNVESIFDDLIAEFETPGAVFREIIHTGSSDQNIRAHDHFSQDDDESVHILSSLGVVRYDVLDVQAKSASLTIDCLSLTAFGIRFVMACDPNLRREVKEAVEERDRKFEESKRATDKKR